MAPSNRQGEEGRGDGIQVLTIVPVEKTGACKNVPLRGWHCCDARQKRPGDDRHFLEIVEAGPAYPFIR